MNHHDIPIETLLKKAPEAAEFMRLFGTSSRLMLLCHIAQKERSVSEIQEDLNLKQPGLSQQLAELRQAGVVKTRRESRQIYYSIADERIEATLDLLFVLFCGNQRGEARSSVRTISPRLDDFPASNPPSEAAHFARVEIPKS